MQVCTSSTAAYTLAVDMKLTQDEAILFCENLGGSSLTFKSSKKELVAFATWFSAKMKGCRHIWTPYSDREEEGKLPVQIKSKTICCAQRIQLSSYRFVEEPSKQEHVLFIGSESDGTWTTKRGPQREWADHQVR